MSNELMQRRNFLKRASIAGTVLATSVVAVSVTAEDKHRGEGDALGNGVVTGSSKKKEVLYKKTQHWNEFYNSAK